MYTQSPSVGSSAAPSLRFDLRAQTQDAHQRLDATIGDLTDWESYRAYLPRQLAFRGVIEAALAATTMPDWFAGWQPLPVADALRADLADLGLAPWLDEPFDTASLADPAALIGTLYVLEGSALGAQLLYRRAQALGATATHAARHLALQSGNKEGWRGFLAVLEQAERRIDRAAAVRAANATFARAQRAFAPGPLAAGSLSRAAS